MTELTRRKFIQGISACIIAGSIPKFIPALIASENKWAKPIVDWKRPIPALSTDELPEIPGRSFILTDIDENPIVGSGSHFDLFSEQFLKMNPHLDPNDVPHFAEYPMGFGGSR